VTDPREALAEPTESFDPAGAELDPFPRFLRWWALAREASPYADAMTLADAEREGPAVGARMLSPAEALADLPAVQVTALGLKRASHGNTVGPEHLQSPWIPPSGLARRVRILEPGGALVAVAESRGGALHPVVVLGYN
jgi:hypothetical protein